MKINKNKIKQKQNKITITKLNLWQNLMEFISSENLLKGARGSGLRENVFT